MVRPRDRRGEIEACDEARARSRSSLKVAHHESTSALATHSNLIDAAAGDGDTCS